MKTSCLLERNDVTDMAADIPSLEVTRRKSKQDGGRSNWKNNQGFQANLRPEKGLFLLFFFLEKRTLYYYNNKAKQSDFLAFS